MSSKHRKGSSNMSRLPAFLAGLLVGGLVGAAAMFLLAPRAGEKTRSQILKQGKKLRHQAAQSTEAMMTEAGDNAHHFTDSVHKEAVEFQQHAQELLAEAKK